MFCIPPLFAIFAGMIRITIEAYSLALPYGGFRTFVTELCEGIARRAPELRDRYGLEFTVVVPPGMEGRFGGELSYMALPKSARRWIRFSPKWRSDLFHMPTQYSVFRSMPRAPLRLMTIHDVNFIHEKTGLSLWYNRFCVSRRLAGATHLSFISQFSMDDTRHTIPHTKPGRVIYNGVTEASEPLAVPEFAGRLPEGFLLHISSLSANKNPELMIRMMEELPEHHLVIAGRWNSRQDLREMVAAAPNITALTDVTDDERTWLYGNCRAFLFPSQCEGFGLPPVEAMKYGKPVFLSTLTSLPEVGGDAAFYWPDLTPGAMARGLREGLAAADAEPGFSARVKANAARFRWDTCVDGYISLYLDMFGIDARRH